MGSKCYLKDACLAYLIAENKVFCFVYLYLLWWFGQSINSTCHMSHVTTPLDLLPQPTLWHKCLFFIFAQQICRQHYVYMFIYTIDTVLHSSLYTFHDIEGVILVYSQGGHAYSWHCQSCLFYFVAVLLRSSCDVLPFLLLSFEFSILKSVFCSQGEHWMLLTLF